MKKALPDGMFAEAEQVRLSAFRKWILDQKVTEIVMTEQQFWNFVTVQPLAEKPWATFMGRRINVSDMPEAAQKHLGIFDTRNAGAI
jgi:hypothetical protein